MLECIRVGNLSLMLEGPGFVATLVLNKVA